MVFDSKPSLRSDFQLLKVAVRCPEHLETPGVTSRVYNNDEGQAMIFEAKDDDIHIITVTIDGSENIVITNADGEHLFVA